MHTAGEVPERDDSQSDGVFQRDSEPEPLIQNAGATGAGISYTEGTGQNPVKHLSLIAQPSPGTLMKWKERKQKNAIH